MFEIIEAVSLERKNRLGEYHLALSPSRKLVIHAATSIFQHLSVCKPKPDNSQMLYFIYNSGFSFGPYQLVSYRH
jgi:hypothetical protein